MIHSRTARFSHVGHLIPGALARALALALALALVFGVLVFYISLVETALVFLVAEHRVDEEPWQTEMGLISDAAKKEIQPRTQPLGIAGFTFHLSNVQ
jgi:hypothetical protein